MVYVAVGILVVSSFMASNGFSCRVESIVSFRIKLLVPHPQTLEL